MNSECPQGYIILVPFIYWLFSSLMNIISKFGTTSGPQQRSNEPPSPALSPTSKHLGSHSQAPLNGTALSVPGTVDTSTLGLSESQLRRQALECLVAVLRSLVAWGTAAGKADVNSTIGSTRVLTNEENRRDVVPQEEHLDKLSVSAGSADTFHQSTPELIDDPTKFESAKQKKTTLLEGIKKFNFKPKRVRLPRYSSPTYTNM